MSTYTLDTIMSDSSDIDYLFEDDEMSDYTPSLLCELPAELRNKVYTEYMASFYAANPRIRINAEGYILTPPLPSVSRQMRSEALGYLANYLSSAVHDGKVLIVAQVQDYNFSPLYARFQALCAGHGVQMVELVSRTIVVVKGYNPANLCGWIQKHLELPSEVPLFPALATSNADAELLVKEAQKRLSDVSEMVKYQQQLAHLLFNWPIYPGLLAIHRQLGWPDPPELDNVIHGDDSLVEVIAMHKRCMEMGYHLPKLWEQTATRFLENARALDRGAYIIGDNYETDTEKVFAIWGAWHHYILGGSVPGWGKKGWSFPKRERSRRRQDVVFDMKEIMHAFMLDFWNGRRS